MQLEQLSFAEPTGIRAASQTIGLFRCVSPAHTEALLLWLLSADVPQDARLRGK